MQRGGWTKEMMEQYRPCVTMEYIRETFNRAYKVGDTITMVERDLLGGDAVGKTVYNTVDWKIIKIFPYFAVVQHRGSRRALNLVSWWVEREKASI